MFISKSAPMTKARGTLPHCAKMPVVGWQTWSTSGRRLARAVSARCVGGRRRAQSAPSASHGWERPACCMRGWRRRGRRCHHANWTTWKGPRCCHCPCRRVPSYPLLLCGASARACSEQRAPVMHKPDLRRLGSRVSGPQPFDSLCPGMMYRSLPCSSCTCRQSNPQRLHPQPSPG